MSNNGEQPEIEAIIAKAMTQLSVQEREEVMNELHAVAQLQPENPQQMHHLLLQMETALQEATPTEDCGYVLAEFLDPAFVQNRELRLRFLRADRYDARAAAERMLQYIDLKQRAFGYTKLISKIKQNDLNADALEILSCGVIRVMPMPDCAGRTIIVIYPSLITEKSSKAWEQMRFYLLSFGKEKEQLQGLIWIICFDSTDPLPTYANAVSYTHLTLPTKA